MEFDNAHFNDEKDMLIEKLIALGIYKQESLHLFELTVSELEKVYAKAACDKQF